MKTSLPGCPTGWVRPASRRGLVLPERGVAFTAGDRRKQPVDTDARPSATSAPAMRHLAPSPHRTPCASSGVRAFRSASLTRSSLSLRATQASALR